jgi:hypothetical protein
LSQNIFAKIRQEIDCQKLAVELGLKPNHAGMICCPDPAHADKTASCKLYRNGAYCFGCGRRFSAIDLTMLQKPLTTYEAARWLQTCLNASAGYHGDKVTSAQTPAKKSINIEPFRQKQMSPLPVLPVSGGDKR